MNENMSRLLPRLLADREYFEMSQGLLEFILVVLGLVDYNQPLPQLKKYEMKKYHMVILPLGWQCSTTDFCINH